MFAYGMRWTRLFDDLEAQLIRLEQAERAADVSDRVRSERGQITLHEHPITHMLTLDEVARYPFREHWLKEGYELFHPLETLS